MKTASSDLFDLLHSLNKAERRYIQLHTKGMQYGALMNALFGQDEYNEKRLKEQYADAAFVKHLAVSKRYLYDWVLKMLDRFNQQGIFQQVEQGERKVRVLFKKGLHKQANKLLQKQKKLAYQYELYERILNLLTIEKQLLVLGIEPDKIQILYAEEQKVLEQLANINDYWRLLNESNALQMQFQKVQSTTLKQKIEELTNDERLTNFELASTLQSQSYFYQTNATLSFMKGDTQKAYAFNTAYLELLESQTAFLRRFPEQYLVGLNNFLIDSFELKKYTALEEGLEKLEAIPQNEIFKKIKNIEVRVFRSRYLLEVNWRLGMRDYVKGVALIPRLEEGLEKYGQKIEKHHQVTFHYLAASLLFGNFQYAAALNWVNMILDDRRQQVVKEIYQFTRILNLLIHERLQNWELLESILPNTRRYLRTQRDLYKTEKRVFQFFNERLKATSSRETANLYTRLKEDLEVLSKDVKEERVFNYIDFEVWLKE